MKIISKFKDFYDYKVGKYGIDEKLIFDRREPVVVDEKTLIPESVYKHIGDSDALHSVIYIGNNMVHVFATKNKVYTHFDMENYKELDTAYFSYFDKIYFTFNDSKKIRIISEFVHYDSTFSDLLKTGRKNDSLDMEGFDYIHGYSKEPPQINEWSELNQVPVLLVQKFIDESVVKHRRTNSKGIRKRVFINPSLDKIGVYIDADWIWQSLTEFLSMLKSEKEVSPEMSNEEKILSKGFDSKNSFRSKMKNK
ncbi:hypothetical protein EII29_00410 [Leptotrichia sp. OH3620_COT-345]|uniref:hypothetical protein n=1 Tax=Leptotrichia sp. OH3620_COT-345 TaxID=2491048 RepID=UPI000F655AEC|nr:hypothetical protein [Leptotrichia sp. OH3620_COT-345]RRD40948.1 hypothetical protein EII29_00410 [Leptotrichia sp. OH3620_COT-345]